MSLTWRGREAEGWNWVKRVGYFWKNFRAVLGRFKRGLRRDREERGRDLDGEERISFLTEMACLRSFSLETALSRYGSRTHLTLAAMKVR